MRLPSERKRLLLAGAPCRSHWDRLPDPLCRRAVEVAERYADGLVDDQEREAVQTNTRAVADQLWRNGPHGEYEWAWRAAQTLVRSVPFTSSLVQLRSLAEPQPEECALLRA